MSNILDQVGADRGILSEVREPPETAEKKQNDGVYQVVRVHFESMEDLRKFEKLIGRKIDVKRTKSITWPHPTKGQPLPGRLLDPGPPEEEEGDDEGEEE